MPHGPYKTRLMTNVIDHRPISKVAEVAEVVKEMKNRRKECWKTGSTRRHVLLTSVPAFTSRWRLSGCCRLCIVSWYLKRKGAILPAINTLQDEPHKPLSEHFLPLQRDIFQLQLLSTDFHGLPMHFGMQMNFVRRMHFEAPLEIIKVWIYVRDELLDWDTFPMLELNTSPADNGRDHVK